MVREGEKRQEMISWGDGVYNPTGSDRARVVHAVVNSIGSTVRQTLLNIPVIGCLKSP